MTVACGRGVIQLLWNLTQMKVIDLRRLLSATLLAITVAGCTTLPADHGWGLARAELAGRSPSLAGRSANPGADADAVFIAVENLLAQPLTLPAALSVALLQNPRVQIAYEKLGLASADWLAASRLSNPVLSGALLDSDEPGTRRLKTLGLAQNFTDILFLRANTRIADADMQVARLEAAAAIQSLATEVAAAWYAAVAAEQVLKLRQLIAAAADASMHLAERFHAAGNISLLELAREQAAAHQVQTELAAARAEATAAMSALNALLGLPGPAGLELAAALPLPVSTVTDVEDLIDLGLTRRFDVAIQQKHIESLQRTVALAQSLRWLPFIEVGVERERETDGARLRGPTMAIELPLFGRNKAPMLRAESALAMAQAELQLLQGDISNVIAAAHAQMSAAAEQVAVYRSALVPARATIVKQMQLHQNYMLVGQFELLKAKRDELEAYEGYLHAIRDYWTSRVALSVATGGELPGDDAQPSPAVTAPEIATPPASEHKGHH